MNLFDTLFNFSKYGTLSEYWDNDGSLSETFSVSSNTVSCANESTSCHTLPSESLTLIISTTLEFANLILEYFFAPVNVWVSVVILPLLAWTYFFNK